MLEILLTIGAILLVAVAAILLYAATKPNVFRYARATSVKAPAETIFPFINEFDKWKAWSPYEKKDPAMKRTYSGPSGGKGAVYAWHGDKNVGRGRMEIVDVSPPSKIVIKLDFFSPFEAHNTATFTMEPKGDSTNVTWAMDGPNLFIGKVMSIFIDVDKMVGKDFEAGLANLKALAETPAA